MNTLCDCIITSFEKYGSNPAIDVNGRTYSYQDLETFVAPCVSALSQVTVKQDVVGIFAHRSIHAYTGIYATLLAGNCYMPINPRFPASRIHYMMDLAKCKTLILSKECLDTFRAIAPKHSGLRIIYMEQECDLSYEYPAHTFIGTDSFEATCQYRIPEPHYSAYLMFTSGSTGIPKGVPVSHCNVSHYVEYSLRRYAITPRDRASQMFDTTFDLSVHDLFVTMAGGAMLCVPQDKNTAAPYSYIVDKQITVWFSVPSIVMLMDRMHMLKSAGFPALRLSLFCGEALPVRSVEAWRAAAPNSAIENLYGPTEATIAITNYQWSDSSPDECVNGIVPIGTPFPSHEYKIVDRDLLELPTNNDGELCLSGPQVTAGYLANPEETRKKFIRFPGSPQIWYRTGDVVRNTSHGLVYLGRIDDQVQIRGFRVELQEIDKALREASGTDMAIVAPIYAHDQNTVTAIYGFVAGNPSLSADDIQDICRDRLPDYMVPAKILFVEKLPLNTNGKIDRKELSKWR